MKKNLILLIIIIFLSGCSAQYNLEFKDDKFIEKINVKANENSISYFKDNVFYAIMDGASNFQKYKKNINNYNIDLSYSYKDLDYNKATPLSSCFNAYNIIKQGKYYIISTSNGITCATEEDTVLLDSLKIVLKTNHQVKENNADKVDGYIYTWNIDKNNYSNKNIYIKLYKDKYVFNYENEFYKQIALYGGISCAIIGIVTFIIIKFIKKRKQSNKI